MHIYTDTDGNNYPSVTTIIHQILVNPNPLLKWSNIMGFKHKKYEDVMDASANFGALMHSVMESYMTNKEIPSINDLIVLRKVNVILDQFDKFRSGVNLKPEDTMLVEESIISKTLGYAGTIDWLGTYKNELAIIDYKTSKTARLGFFIQLSAYDKLLQTEKNIKVNKATILTLREDGVRNYDVTREELDYYYEIFEHMKAIYEKVSKLEECST